MANRDRRWSALLWLTIGCLLFGYAEAGAPLEFAIRNVRDAVRAHDASGQVVVVGVDDATIETLREWPIRRRHYATLIDKLNAQGARRIFIAINFPNRSSGQDDLALARSMSRSSSEVVLPVSFNVDRITGRRVTFRSDKLFQALTSGATINLQFDPFGTVRRLPYALEIGAHLYPSFAAKLAGRKGEAGQSFPIDYSVRLSSIPTLSAVDVLNDRVRPGFLRGRDVLIGTTPTQLGDNYFVPNIGSIAGVFIQALGAETLIAGEISEPSWLFPFLMSFILVLALFFMRRKRLVAGIYCAGIVLTFTAPFILDSRHIYVEIVPALALLIAAGARVTWSTYRAAYKRRGVINIVSGLPNFNALRAVESRPNIALVAARIRNFPEIIASLASDHERSLVEQIARRLALGSGGATIYQGDEGMFAWLMPCETVSFTSDQFDALTALFRNAVAVGDRHVDLAITFGLASDGSLSPFNRLGGALMAADAAAEEGLHWKMYEPARPSDSSWKLSLLGRLDAAIDAGEIWVAYQPKIDLASDRIIGAEALVRWAHPEKGPVSPADFIPVAEQQNRVGKLTYHVLEKAIRAAASINAHGIRFGMAVNLSVRLLDDPALVERVSELLNRHGLAPERLILEITETAAMSENSHSIAVLDALRAIGVGLSIDDYGTGFSNLENLRTIPATEIKIDRSFINTIDVCRSDAVMVRSTIQMAHSLGRVVVAEGVERTETLETLRAMACDTVQGYLTGRPMKFASLSRLLLRARHQSAA